MFVFFNDTATTEIYTLSLHDALPISSPSSRRTGCMPRARRWRLRTIDRKSTRLNSSHGYISYAVFCLKKKEPQALLRKREWQRAVTLDAFEWRILRQLVWRPQLLDAFGDAGNGWRFEHPTQRQVDLKLSFDTRFELNGEQRVSTEIEEVVVYAASV